MAMATVTVSAQTALVKLKSKSLTRQQAISEIQAQTQYRVLSDPYALDKGLTVNFGRTELPLHTVLDKLTEGTNIVWTIDGNYILIHRNGGAKESVSVVSVTADRTLTGTVTNKKGDALEGVSVEVVGIDGKKATTFANGRFGIEGVPSGSHVVKLTTADGETIRYREVNVSAGRDADVTLTMGDEILAATPRLAQSDTTPATASGNKATAYYVPTTATDNTVRAFSDEPKAEYGFIPYNRMRSDYLPKAAVKSNLLYLAAVSPNVALEFGLARKWTLDVSAVYNPFQLQKSGINRFGFVQPEVRYWFCQRFEKHFIGLHGIYGRFNIGQVDFLTRTFVDHRYKGWGAGAGISYGYHLPIAKRWAMEFTVGAGYVYLEYDKFRCYECDDYLGTQKRRYLGPTKAGISLIYMIK